MSGMRYNQNRQFQHGWNMSWSKLSVSARLECVMVKIVCFSTPGMCHGQNCLFQNAWNILWSQLSVSAFLECVMVKILRFSMARMSGRKNQNMCMCPTRAFGRHFRVHDYF
jgi:hypothetical protein